MLERGFGEMADTAPVDRAVEDARAWVRELGPAWVARFDQMHADIRTWAERVGVDPLSYEFRAAWCVAATFLHRLARNGQEDDDEETGDWGLDLDDESDLSHTANIMATVGLWGEAGLADLSPRSDDA